MSGAKRKRTDNPETEPVPPLRIQAYEADLVRDRPNLAEALERRDGEGVGRGGLIRLGEGDVWVDRFDVRLLLDTLPPPSSSSTHNEDPLSDIGWSDLPSDSEDTFFLTRDETAQYRHEKRKREMEQGRLDRLRALAEQEGEVEEEGEKWGGSDEEPDEAQTNLMTRTATHILASPNPAQLEMRILANHGADPRFAFLKGRWKRAWVRMKNEASKEEREKEGAGERKEKTGGIGGLAGYASGSENESEGEGSGEAGERKTACTVGGAPMSNAADENETERVKAERRARALEWMRKRRDEGREHD
ncbi:hypothetical protein FRC07_010103 [Ceratobasidium sp. 392]|nr:hypothetical protein FRC07_010103 [Ceratobasidium sp. 392]